MREMRSGENNKGERFYFIWALKWWWARLLSESRGVVYVHVCNKFGWSEEKGGGNANFCGGGLLLEQLLST